MDLAAQLAEVDRLRARPFPAQRVREGAVASGPGFHVADLAVSEDLDDADPARWEEVRDDYEALCQALVELLAARWGDPETLDLQPLLAAMEEATTVPPPLDDLCAYVPEVYGWRVGDRWIGVGIGRGGAALPCHLVLAVGERTAYERARHIGRPRTAPDAADGPGRPTGSSP